MDDGSPRRARPSPEFYRRRAPHLQPGDRFCLITFCTASRRVLPPPARDLVLQRCVIGHGSRFWLSAAVVMPDHVHLLLSPLADEHGATYSLGDILSGIKRASAHDINHLLGRTGSVWQREWFDHALRSDESTQAKADYLCQNPVRAGLVEHEDDYPWLWRLWVEGERDRAS